MRFVRPVPAKAQGLVPAQQEKSYVKVATRPVLVTDKLRTPNPQAQDAEIHSRAETPLDRQRRLRARYGKPLSYLKLG